MDKFDTLKSKQRHLRDGFPKTMGLRLHRAISWIGKADQTKSDPDAAFLSCWIAFNAAYADETNLATDTPLGERSQFVEFLTRLVKLDLQGQLHDALWRKFRGPVAKLM